jgi:hypothetical protein
MMGVADRGKKTATTCNKIQDGENGSSKIEGGP